MRVFLMQYYYGLWQNLYQMEWPVRFLIEWAFILLLLSGCAVLIYVLAKKCKVRDFLVKGWCIGVREIVYLLGHEKKWAVTADNRMIDWALKKLDRTGSGKRHLILKGTLVLTPVVIYFLAVFVDLPAAAHISEGHLSGLSDIKDFFVHIEVFLSKGYEQYPPLFVQREESEDAAAEEALSESEDRESVVIRLNDEGKDGSNIRSEPDLSTEGNIVGGVNKDSEILYGNEWTYDGKRYWVKVYIPEEGIEGWLSGKLVDREQLDDIVEGRIK